MMLLILKLHYISILDRIQCNKSSTIPRICIYYKKMKSGKNENADYILLNLMPPDTQKPSFQKAMQHRRLYSAIGRNREHSKIKHAFTFNTDAFKKYGSGVYLYFSLIQMLFFTFIILSLNSLPIFISNFKGNGLKVYGEHSLSKALMQLSLGNQRGQQYQRILQSQQIRLDLQISQILIILVDIANSLIFFTFLVYWKIKSDKSVQQLISEDALPSYYTLQITNLPKGYREDTLIQHFYKFGADIAQISTVYNYQQVLSQIKNLIQLVDDYAACQSEKHQKQKIYECIVKKMDKIKNMTKFKQPKPVIAFVTFQDMIMRKKIKDLYKYRICARELRYQGKLIKVSNCRVQPSSILWENYHLQIKTQIRQSVLISIILASVLLLALLSLFLANAHATSMLEKQTAFSTKFDYTRVYSLQEVKNLGTIQAIFVYCSKLTYHDFSIQTYYLCEPYFSSYKQKFSVMIGLSALVVTINCLINYIICNLANYRRYKTKTQKSRFLILNIFILYFINSGLLMLLIRVQLGGYSLGKLITSIVSLPASQFSTQSYSDFTRKWYLNIGSQIVMIHAVSLMVSPFIQIVINWFQAKYRAFMAKRQKTQFKMNQTLLDSEFDFQTFYAMMLNACFFTMFHGNAIPLLYVLAIGAFFCLYVASYIVFRYFSCKPVMFDHTLNAVISRVMCIALIMHQITSILYFYTEDIFPLDVVTHGSTIKNKEERRNQGDALVHKFHQGMPFIILATILIICTINYNRVCRISKKYFYKHFVPGQQQSKQPKLFPQIFKVPQPQQSTSPSSSSSPSPSLIKNRDYEEGYLSSYRMQDNPNYAHISYALKILSIFQPYFKNQSANNVGSHSSIRLKRTEIVRKGGFRGHHIVDDLHDEDEDEDQMEQVQDNGLENIEEQIQEKYGTDRPLVINANQNEN